MAEPLKVLFVCTANICRSPMMEVLLRDQLDPERFEIASAGVRGWEGAPIDSMVVLELARLGHEVTEFRSRPLQLHHIEEEQCRFTGPRSPHGRGSRLPALRARAAWCISAIRRQCTRKACTRCCGLSR